MPQVPTPRLILRLLGLELAGLAGRAARLVGIKRPVPLEPEQLAIPDSAIASKATALARALEPDFVFNHSVRTFLYGVAVGATLDLRADRELLYLASILHDVGLMPEHDGEGSFELNSARAAHAFMTEEGFAAKRAALVHEAIALHTSAGIAGSREPEIALTHFGAGVDVIGVHREDVADATNREILETWPRERFKERFIPLLEDQAQRKPDCHIAGVMKIGFAEKIRRAPFDE